MFITAVFALVLIFALSSISYAETVDVAVFQQAPIHFGEEVSGETWTAKDSGRVIQRTITIPEFSEPMKITARLKLESEGDPWDRFGTVYLVQPESADVELLKFMTGFGTGLPYKRDDIPAHPTVEKWAEYSLWENDVSHLAHFLQGEVTIEAIIDTWVSPGWKIDFDLIFEPAEKKTIPDWTTAVFNNTGEYWTKERFASDEATIEVEIPAGLESVRMFYLTSGHGGRSSGDEFNKKDHVIYIDGKEVLRFVPWREDGPLFRKFSPTSGKWDGDVWSSDLSRSNWIPGDQVKPMVFELGEHLTPGKHTIRFQVENMADSTPDNLNYWNTSVVLAGYSENPVEPETLVPYLQAPNPDQITISWIYNDDYASIVEYGEGEELDLVAEGSTETIGGKVVWHTVQLENLKPATTYFYRVRSGVSSSAVHEFTTPPARGSGEPLLIGLVRREAGQAETKAVLNSLAEMVESTGEKLNLLLHTGNIVEDGFLIENYVEEFFLPFSEVSAKLPIHIVPGKLEQESMYLYQFVHNDTFADYYPTSSYADMHGRLGEECYQFTLARTRFIIFNTNQLGMGELEWLEKVGAQVEKDADIANLVVLMHQSPDTLSSFVQNRIVAHLDQTQKPKLIIHGDGASFSTGKFKAYDSIGLGSGDKIEPAFALLRIDGEAQTLTIEAYVVTEGEGKAELKEKIKLELE